MIIAGIFHFYPIRQYYSVILHWIRSINQLNVQYPSNKLLWKNILSLFFVYFCVMKFILIPELLLIDLPRQCFIEVVRTVWMIILFWQIFVVRIILLLLSFWKFQLLMKMSDGLFEILTYRYSYLFSTWNKYLVWMFLCLFFITILYYRLVSYFYSLYI